MNDQPSTPDPDMTPGAIPNILRAFFRNQERWLERLSTGEPEPSLPHTRIRHDVDVCAVRTGRSGVICLDLTVPDDTPDLAAFERAWAWVRAYGTQDVLVWSPVDRPAMSLALQARGFEASFRPSWMGRSLSGELPTSDVRNVRIRIATPEDIDSMIARRDIPYLIPDQVETTRRLALNPHKRAVWWLVARDRHGILGQAIVNMTDEIAGLFNVAVHPEARRRGIGRALTAAAMRVARENGATRMALNATDEGLGLYTGLGFEHLGKGTTWFLPARRSRLAPDRELVAIAEAIGDGRIEDLDEGALPVRLPNGDLPMTFAARFGQREMVQWLLERGSTPDVLALWDVGLTDVAALVINDPAVVNRPSGPNRATPLHIAVQRGDVPLAKMLIAAGANLNARDTQFRSTPLGWAEYLDHPLLARIIRKAGGR